ncbi:MAG: tRNA (adenosine(37)-N6)-threonylcarbamoyltransferase complex dimerization subunit type 1 TsaB [Bacteroidota bacterium]|nr:tRNA (adenosine(37)-N6)-threonylcarbamoyltransferase complex dimerization subunit type 1 TsaB [Bacteroidota bacterium]
MPWLLHIETATPVCSVALSHNGQLAGIRESNEKNSHSSRVTVFIDELLKEAGLEPAGLDAVSISEGPGSYTGLRIGVATAKGLCFAIGKPMIAVSTLQAMALGLARKFKLDDKDLFCPMIDARRMEVFTGIFDSKGNLLHEITAEIITEQSFQEFLKDHRLHFGGDGAAKCREILSKNPNTCFHDDFSASSEYMIPLAEERFIHKHFENIAYFEPFYLKDFVAGKPHVKGLR